MTDRVRISKAALRAELIARRDALSDQGERSEKITQMLLLSPEFRLASRMVAYMGVRSEVSTLTLISSALLLGKQVSVPYCDGDSLALFSLVDFSELEPGAFGIPEPRASFRVLTSRRVPLSSVDLAVIPGVGFDPYGNRLGYGRGYFDRFLSSRPATLLLVGLAFECQIVPELPREEHDVRVDIVVTERTIYNCRRASFSL